MQVIDLRSDTLTKPTPEMRRLMAEAPVGDDVYGEDPTVNELQDYGAALLGKEAALFVPSGVMGNQICINIHTQPGDEVIVDSEAHIFHYETAAPAVISQVQLRPVCTRQGVFDLAALPDAVRSPDYHNPRSSLLCIENTHNRYGGAVVSQEHVQACGEFARAHDMAFHCDGARLWNACAASGIEPAEYVAACDTVSVCLSKGLGAPVGSLIAGSREHMQKALKVRKMLGGGMRQAGIVAAAGLYVLKEHRALLVGDNEKAQTFARELLESQAVEVDLAAVQSNMVVFATPAGIQADKLMAACRERGLLIALIKPGFMRAVFYHQVPTELAVTAAQRLVDAIQSLRTA